VLVLELLMPLSNTSEMEGSAMEPDFTGSKSRLTVTVSLAGTCSTDKAEKRQPTNSLDSIIFQIKLGNCSCFDIK
jgi:hypothetical protein